MAVVCDHARKWTTEDRTRLFLSEISCCTFIAHISQYRHYQRYIPHICQFLHSQIFWRIKFTPNFTQSIANLHSKLPISVKKLHQAIFFYTDTVCGVCDKYEVCHWTHLLATCIPYGYNRTSLQYNARWCKRVKESAR